MQELLEKMPVKEQSGFEEAKSSQMVTIVKGREEKGELGKSLKL